MKNLIYKKNNITYYKNRNMAINRLELGDQIFFDKEEDAFYIKKYPIPKILKAFRDGERYDLHEDYSSI